MGSLYLILPTNNFKYVWFDNNTEYNFYTISDATAELRRSDIFKERLQINKWSLRTDRYEERLVTRNKANPIALENDPFLVDEMTKILKKKMPYETTNLHQAILDKHEIMFSHCEYYGIKTSYELDTINFIRNILWN